MTTMFLTIANAKGNSQLFISSIWSHHFIILRLRDK